MIGRSRTAGPAVAPHGMTIATVAVISGFLLRPALAHPHVLISAHTEIAFNRQGELTNITNISDFDEAFSVSFVGNDLLGTS
jgi:ABC-type uncharacterized transport system substrate-binding protein